jgi:phospholipid/cholesterol/gamma-HCH transport system ATP-binding protein
MVFQASALFDSLSVFENVAFPLREHDPLPEPELRARVQEKLALVGLEGVEHQLPGELSGGMRKRVAVARAIVRDPEIVLYDEPTAGLDPANARRIAEQIAGLRRRLRVSSVVVTHDLALTAAVSDRVGLLHEGRLAQVGTWPELQRAPGPELHQFLGAELGAA